MPHKFFKVREEKNSLRSPNEFEDPSLYESDPVGAIDAISPTWRQALNPSLPPPAEGTIKTSVFTLLSTIIGGGVLSIPFTLAACGVGLGLFLITFMATASAYSANLLVWSAHRSGAETYQDVALRTYGNKCAKVVSILVLLLVIMASIGYVVLMGDLATRLFPPLLNCSCAVGETNGQVAYCLEKNRWMYMAMSVAIVFPVTLVKKMSALRITSIISVLSIIFLAGTLSWESANDNINHEYKNQILVAVDSCIAEHLHDRLYCIQWLPVLKGHGWLNILLSIPILSCSYMCHFNVLPMHKELRRATRKRMGSVISWTMGFAMVLCECILVVAVTVDVTHGVPFFFFPFFFSPSRHRRCAGWVFGFFIRVAHPTRWQCIKFVLKNRCSRRCGACWPAGNHHYEFSPVDSPCP